MLLQPVTDGIDRASQHFYKFNYINLSSPILETWAQGRDCPAAALQPLPSPPRRSRLPPQPLWRTKPCLNSTPHWLIPSRLTQPANEVSKALLRGGSRAVPA